MPDDMERAQQLRDEHRRDAVIAHFRRGIRNAMYGSDLVCEMCGAEIPEERRHAAQGCTRCIDCQTSLENTHHRRS